MHSSKVKEISLIGILAAVNIASRIYLQALPNIKPGLYTYSCYVPKSYIR